MTTPTTARAIVGKPVPRPARDATARSFVPEILKGIRVTMRHFFVNTKQIAFDQRNDPVLDGFADGLNLISYPEQKRPYPDRNRGLHRLLHRDDGSPRCVACLCCSTACPAQGSHIVPAASPAGDARRGYERFPGEFVIDELRCIFCGFCVEACPCDAIRMDTGHHATPYDSRDQFIYRKDMLMSFTGRDGSQTTENPRHEPGEATHPGVDRHHAH